MIKTFKFQLKVIIITFFAFLFLINTLPVKAASEDAYLIMANPAVDSNTSMNITWHSQLLNVRLEYTTKDDVDFNNKIVCNGVAKELTIYDGTTDGNITDYKYDITIDSLTPDTEYIYRVGKTTMSKVYSFKTGGESNYQFAIVSDFHTYSKLPARLEKTNSIISTMDNNAKDFRFVLSCGDSMAYGTNRGYWQDLCNSSLIQNYMFASTPGNHDYYNPKAEFKDASYFNAYTNNPDNGPEGLKNTTYYFRYGETLFISLNSEDACTNATLKNIQKEWLEEVLENNTSKFIVVYFHRGMYPGSGSNTGHATTMKAAYQGLFDKYGVDLVFGGHDHVYVRTKRIFNGTTATEGFGAIYINLPQIGDRGSAMNTVMTDINKKIGDLSGAVLARVSKDSIALELYNDNGEILDRVTIDSKASTINTEDYLTNSVDISYTDKFSNMNLLYGSNIFQKAYKIEVLENDKVVLSFRPEYNVNKMSIPGVSDTDFFKKYLVKIYMRDGEVASKEYTEQNQHLDFGEFSDFTIDEKEMKLTWTSNLKNDVIKSFLISDDGIETKLETSKTEYQLKGSLYSNKIVIFKALNENNEEIFRKQLSYGKDYSDITFNCEDIKVNINKEIKINVTNSYDLPLEYTYTFDDEYIKLVNNVLCAIKIGTTKVTVKSNDFFKEIEVNVIIEKALEYTISYDLDGGTLTNTIDKAIENETISLDNPTKKGYKFIGWFTDKELTNEFNGIINENVTLYAKWEKNSGCNNLVSVLYMNILLLGLIVLKKKRII